MRKKMHEVILCWREKKETDKSLEFSHTKKGENKSFKARITTDKTGASIVELISLKGYNKKYLKYQLSHYFDLFNTELQNVIGTGDKILTRHAASSPPAIGTNVILPEETYYYAVNNGLVYCNGEKLGRQWTATYLGFSIERCSLDAAPVRYTRFKLQ